MQETAGYAARGSEELFRRLNKPYELDESHLKHLVATAEKSSAKILDWTVFGKPGIDRLRASFELAPEQLTAFIDGVVQNKARFNWRVFPRGVPPIIDGYVLDLQTDGGGF